MIEKSQILRLVDVFVIGPLLIYAGVTTPPQRNLLKYSLFYLGVGTLLYNGYHYIEVRTRPTLISTPPTTQSTSLIA